MAPRELLALKLPEQPDPSGGAGSDAGGTDDTSEDGASPDAPSLDDLKPFERGPEITEIH
jgi:hypothetical protein